MFIRYEKKNGSVVLTRLYGDNPIVKVPAYIDGDPVTGLGEYCFSEREVSLSEECNNLVELEKVLERGDVRSLSGDYITEVILPKTIISIGDLCFYGCRKLHSVTLYSDHTDNLSIGTDMSVGVPAQQMSQTDEKDNSRDITIGADVFMNCNRLDFFELCVSVEEKTSLRRILMQRNAATFVRFSDAAAYFPEFSEHYDLVGPAHIFELAIDGHGLRARQCFENEVFRPEAYDAMFEQAAVSEDEETLCRMAAARLQFPRQLSDNARQVYETYLGGHADAFFEDAVHRRDLSLVLSLKKQGVLTTGQIKKCLLMTTREGWVEGTRMLLAK